MNEIPQLEVLFTSAQPDVKLRHMLRHIFQWQCYSNLLELSRQIPDTVLKSALYFDIGDDLTQRRLADALLYVLRSYSDYRASVEAEERANGE